jgi:hypothetical protein
VHRVRRDAVAQQEDGERVSMRGLSGRAPNRQSSQARLALLPISILDNDLVSMWYHPEAGILHHQFHKHIWGAAFRAVLNKGLEVLGQRSGHRWLSDDRENCSLSQEDTDWAINDWFPRVLKIGWHHWGIVLPDHVIGKMNMRRFIDSYSATGVIVRVFPTSVLALKWLEAPD